MTRNDILGFLLRVSGKPKYQKYLMGLGFRV
jgi:hypothetical protein